MSVEATLSLDIPAKTPADPSTAITPGSSQSNLVLIGKGMAALFPHIWVMAIPRDLPRKPPVRLREGKGRMLVVEKYNSIHKHYLLLPWSLVRWCC